MGWLDELGSSIFGSGGGNTVPSQGGADFYSSLLPSIIQAGTQLAGTYFNLDQAKREGDQAIAMRQAELEAAKEAAAKAGGGGGGGGQRLAALTSLYNNWAQINQRSGESLAQTAQATGKMAQDPLIARASVLR
jgi:hypothetical protein